MPFTDTRTREEVTIDLKNCARSSQGFYVLRPGLFQQRAVSYMDTSRGILISSVGRLPRAREFVLAKGPQAFPAGTYIAAEEPSTIEKHGAVLVWPGNDAGDAVVIDVGDCQRMEIGGAYILKGFIDDADYQDLTRNVRIMSVGQLTKARSCQVRGGAGLAAGPPITLPAGTYIAADDTRFYGAESHGIKCVWLR